MQMSLHLRDFNQIHINMASMKLFTTFQRTSKVFTANLSPLRVTTAVITRRKFSSKK